MLFRRFKIIFVLIQNVFKIIVWLFIINMIFLIFLPNHFNLQVIKLLWQIINFLILRMNLHICIIRNWLFSSKCIFSVFNFIQITFYQFLYHFKLFHLLCIFSKSFLFCFNFLNLKVSTTTDMNYSLSIQWFSF